MRVGICSTPSSQIYLLAVSALSRGVLIGVFVLAAVATRYVWLPDVISRKEKVVAGLTLGNGQRVELTQTWMGDGYLTRVRHRTSSNSYFRVVGDFDTAKVWSCSVSHNTNFAAVDFRFGKRHWRYYYNLQALSVQ